MSYSAACTPPQKGEALTCLQSLSRTLLFDVIPRKHALLAVIQFWHMLRPPSVETRNQVPPAALEACGLFLSSRMRTCYLWVP
jgi:hypothetical protein